MKEYTATKAENPCNRPNMEAAVSMLKAFGGEGNVFAIQEIYLDRGAGMMWETILCIRNNKDPYQMLSPHDWERIQNATTPWAISEIVEDIIASQKELLGL